MDSNSRESSSTLEESSTTGQIESEATDKTKLRRTSKACDMCVKKRRKCTGNMPFSNVPLNAINEDQHWTVGAFSWIEVNENGRLSTKEWTSVYFSNIHNQFPVLCPDLFYANKHQIPQFLLHAMYAVSIAGASQSASGDFHFTHCKLLFQNSLDSPTAMTVFSILLMSYYSLMYQKSTGGGPSLVAAAIRSFQNLLKSRIGGGLPTYKPLDSIETLSKELMQLLTYVLYEMDYKVGIKYQIPFIFDDPPLNYEPVQSKEPYSPFYKSQFWIHHLKLLEIAKRIQVQPHNKGKQKKDIERWHESLPKYILEAETFSGTVLPSSKPSWKVAYLKIFYHYLIIQLYKTEFKQHMRDKNADSAFEKSVNSAVAIAKLVKNFNCNNPTFQGISLFIYHYIYCSSIVLIISKLIDDQYYKEYFDSNCQAIRYFGKVLYQNRHLPVELNRLKDLTELALAEL
ncbi:hypothetical protein HK103_005629 [Boothiomyces macroporosus]|uniref:Zn(2)-C6 fungal-type domain-containing protein n=1 Tax=Boothiomyces macroporosus TaxID=261099 RepID=A0AAD5UF04_9FUNG|nr:hypothetical protein HK103_005629 [Boothiomyces macroporosus]